MKCKLWISLTDCEWIRKDVTWDICNAYSVLCSWLIKSSTSTHVVSMLLEKHFSLTQQASFHSAQLLFPCQLTVGLGASLKLDFRHKTTFIQREVGSALSVWTNLKRKSWPCVFCMWRMIVNVRRKESESRRKFFSRCSKYTKYFFHSVQKCRGKVQAWI